MSSAHSVGVGFGGSDEIGNKSAGTAAHDTAADAPYERRYQDVFAAVERPQVLCRVLVEHTFVAELIRGRVLLFRRV